MSDDLTARCRAVLLERCRPVKAACTCGLDEFTRYAGRDPRLGHPPHCPSGVTVVALDDAAACMARALDRYHNGYPCDECIPGEGCGNINAALRAARGEEE